MSQAGDKIEQYELLNLIATTNTAQIWEVAQQGGAERLCMKLLLPEAMKDPVEFKLLKYEAKVGKSLSHPNCIRIQEAVTKRDYAFLIMELFRAPTLKSWIATDLQGAQARFAKIVEGSCAALGHLHEKGWVHKDIKPDNLLLSRDGDLRLIDYSVSSKAAGGFSKLIGLKSKHIQGTRSYIPPEIIRKKAPTPQADIYSLGCTFFEVLTGKVPFTASSPNDLLRCHLNDKPRPPSSLNPNVTPEADRLIAWMLAKNPAERPQTMQQLQGEFVSISVFKEPVVEAVEQPVVKKELPTPPAAAPEKKPQPPPPRPAKKPDAAPQPAKSAVTPKQSPPPAPPKAVEPPVTNSPPSVAPKSHETESRKAVDIEPTRKGSSMFRLVFDEENEEQSAPSKKPPADNLLDLSMLEDAEPATEPATKKPDPHDDDDLEFMDELPPVV